MLGHRTLNAQDYLAILKRRWWVICVPAVLVPVAAVITTYFISQEYESTSTLLIEPQKVSSEVVKPPDIGTLQSQLSLTTAKIESRTTLEPIITKYNLYASQHLSMDERVELMRNPQKGINIAPIETQIDRANGLPGFKVTFTADDPHTAQEVCADITGLYTRNSLQDQQNMTAGTTAFIRSQLDAETRKLNDMDNALADFKAKNMGALPDDTGNTTSLIGSLGSRLDATTGNLQRLDQTKSFDETILDQATKATTVAGVTARAESQDESDLAKAQANLDELQTLYHDEHPDVKAAKRRVADLQAQIAKDEAAPPAPVVTAPKTDSIDVVRLKAQIKAIDQEIASEKAQQASINAAMRQAQGHVSASPTVFAKYQELTRDSQVEKATYDKLLGEMNQSQMSTELTNLQEGETFTVLDLANLPLDATFPKQSVFALGGVAGGFMLGLLIAAFLEYRDTALRTERDIWSFTQLPTLAVIAYSGEILDATAGKKGLLRRLFSRKDPKELLAG